MAAGSAQARRRQDGSAAVTDAVAVVPVHSAPWLALVPVALLAAPLSSSACQLAPLPSHYACRVAAAGKAGGNGTGAGRAGDEASGKAGRPPYEQARDELTELVKRLEAGGLTLEQSLQLWERGEQLAAICEEWLEGARARLASAVARQRETGAEPGAPF